MATAPTENEATAAAAADAADPAPAKPAKASKADAVVDDGPAFEPEPGFDVGTDDAATGHAPIDPDLSEPHRDPVAEAEATKINEDLAATLVPMSHPDGGTSDQYKSDKAGNILVPASEADAMIALGFVVAAGA